MQSSQDLCFSDFPTTFEKNWMVTYSPSQTWMVIAEVEYQSVILFVLFYKHTY